MRNPNLEIGEKLKSIRTSRGMTLEDVSAATSVSKPMLGQIERGQSSPTINTLWKIATGMKVPFSAFLEEPEPEYTVLSRADHPLIEEDHGLMQAYPVFPFDPVKEFEIFYIEFSPGCSHHSPRHADGVEEYILVLEGAMDMILNTEKLTLTTGQALRFRADIPHAYCNPYPHLCQVHNIIFYSHFHGHDE